MENDKILHQVVNVTKWTKEQTCSCGFKTKDSGNMEFHVETENEEE